MRLPDDSNWPVVPGRRSCETDCYAQHSGPSSTGRKREQAPLSRRSAFPEAAIRFLFVQGSKVTTNPVVRATWFPGVSAYIGS